jgi:hypothetical protein
MDNTLSHAHGTAMVLAWMVFGSTGILFARYNRALRFGNKRQLLGKSIWFQTHRFLLSLSSLLTLVGFLFILVYARGQWISLSTNNKQLFAHSVFGGILVCCVILQIWLALYRCHPNSRFRLIFSWSHRIIGISTFCFSLINLFLITFVLSKQRIAMIIIVSLWAGWIVIITILFEIIQCLYRKAAALMAANARVNNADQQPVDRNVIPDIETGTNPVVENRRLNKIKLI